MRHALRARRGGAGDFLCRALDRAVAEAQGRRAHGPLYFALLRRDGDLCAAAFHHADDGAGSRADAGRIDSAGRAPEVRGKEARRARGEIEGGARGNRGRDEKGRGSSEGRDPTDAPRLPAPPRRRRRPYPPRSS